MSRYQDYPNVFRVAQEIAHCKHPDKVLDAVHQLLKCGIKDSANGGENFGLTVGNVLTILEGSR